MSRLMKHGVLGGVKLGAAALILYWFGWHVAGLLQDWNRMEPSVGASSLRLSWTATGALAYWAAQACFAYFWYRLLVNLDVPISMLDALSAYSVGTVGKYVPGKALVVVMRTILLPKHHVSRAAVALSVVYETLTMMACGAALAAICLLWVDPTRWTIWCASGAGAVALAIVLHPAAFGVFARFATLLKTQNYVNDLPPRCFRTARRWAIISVVGWAFEGLSFWALTRAAGTGATGFEGVLLATGVAALATLLGFVAVFMPAGIGVRELTIIHLLAPICGRSSAVLVSLLVRLIWTIVDVLVGGVFWGARAVARRTGAAAAAPPGQVGGAATHATTTPEVRNPSNAG